MNSRRKFLGSALTLGAGALFLDPFRAVTEGIADSFILKAHAEVTGQVMTRNYINVLMPGAPIRYQFDQFLRTSSKDLALSTVPGTNMVNPMTCDSYTFNSDGTVTPKMTPFTYNGVMVPHLWSQNVFSSGGQQRPLTELLKHMLVIRGFGSGLDGHQFNSLIQQAPIGGVSTIGGLVAENVQGTFDSVQYPDRGTSGAFFSSHGKSQTRLSGATPLATLMQGFGAPTNKLSRNLKSTHKEAMALAQARLKAFARSSNTGSAIVAQNLTNATDMMAKGVGDIGGFYNAAMTRYKNAIESSMRAINIPGISTKALVSDESGLWSIGAGDMFILSKNRDVRTSLATATITNFAQSLAVAEYLIKEGLASSIDIRADAQAALTILKKETDTAIAFSLAHDMHATGANSVILFITAFYRGLTAGLLELINQLGPVHWANTVIQIQGDFARTARSAGTGSDHGFDQMVTSVFSGAFANGPVVVGNIKQAGHNDAYAGTQGIGAAISGYNQKGVPTPVMAASTVVSLLGTNHNPYANSASPLVTLSNGILKPVVAGKIVA